MAPPFKRVKINAKSPYGQASISPSIISLRSRRNFVEKPLVFDPKTVQKSTEKVEGALKVVKTPARSDPVLDDVFNLFRDPKSKSAKKTNSTKRRNVKKTPKPVLNRSFVCLDDILKDGESLPKENPNKSFIDGVFDKWMEQDPYASVSRYIPVPPASPDRPLTLFSPVKDGDYRIYSEPQVRHGARRALCSPSGAGETRNMDRSTEDWSQSSVTRARREIFLGTTPPFAKQLDSKAYSPCKTFSKINGSACSFGNDSVTYSPNQPSCSTPLTCDAFKTPSVPADRSLAFSGEPLSGVKSLFLERSRAGTTDSPISVTATPAPCCGYTPLRHGVDDTPARPGCNSLTGCAYGASSTPDGAKSTLFFGITCFVEVRYNKEDRSEWVRRELTNYGAKVEKTFNKKVNYVIFKEGKISTYMKAKELNLPVVSLLWIDACKRVGGLVDPALYAPTDDEKYQKEIPLEEARKRERFLRRGQAFLDRLNGILPPKPPRSRTKKKNAVSVTEGKRKRKVAIAEDKQTVKLTQNSKPKAPKKLNFNNAGPSGCTEKKSDSDSDYVSETDSEENEKDNKRRKSAPADLGECSQQKLTQFFLKKTEAKQTDKDLLRTPSKSSDSGPSKDLLNILTGGYTTADKKKRKLFDPNESMSFSPLKLGNVETSPYIKVSPPSKKTRSRTTSSKKSKKVKESQRPLAARKSLAPLMEQEEHEASLTVTSSRNSLACFELEKKSKVPVKCQPRIAFTSIPKDDVSKYKEIIKKLGSFELDTTVTKRTTHLLTCAPAKRTVNLLKALARGCWILDVEWVVFSESNGKWMSEEPFEMKSFSEAVTAYRLEKQAFGKDFSIDHFSSCGPIFVDSDVQPPRSDLIELLKLCGGKVVSVSTSADVVVSLRPSRDSSSEVAIVSPLWILDSITQNTSLSIDQYRI